MKMFMPLAKLDDEQHMVYGYATTPALDSQGEVIQIEAVAAALSDYMRFANIREMHQLSAVGVAKSAELDDKGLYLSAQVVDDAAWRKVKEGVYKGFSIGGRVVTRDSDDPKLITRIELNEISLVDRPANPEAVIDIYKLEGDGIMSIAKYGARNSAADQERIQQVHDTAVALGAACGGSHAQDQDSGDDEDGEGEDLDNSLESGGDDMKETAAGPRGDVLAKFARITAEMAALRRTVAAQSALLRRIADQPAAPKYALETRAVEKGRDGMEKADAEPKDALDAIRKAHRNPLRMTIL